MEGRKYWWLASDLAQIERELESPLGDLELRQLAAFLARATSSLGGLPIYVRIDLSKGLHSLEQYLVQERSRGN